MARGELILRHWNLLRTLQTRGTGVPLRDLAAQFDVSERTIQRDFENLQELGIPIEHEEDDFGKRFWRLPPDFLRSGPLTISLTEALSLQLAEHLTAPLAGTLFSDGLSAVREKVHSLLPARAIEHFRGLDQVVFVRRTNWTDYARHADAIRVLADATLAGFSVDVTYRPLWRPDRYETLFDPYGLVYYDDDLFAVGRSHRADGIRVFKIARIEKAAPTRDSFIRPEQFRAEDHFRHSFGIIQSGGAPLEVVVRFSGPAAALVEERIWHESQRTEWLTGEPTLFGESENGGGLQATFRLADTVEFKRWIKGFGADAEILRPDSLRQELRTELLSTLRRYEPVQK